MWALARQPDASLRLLSQIGRVDPNPQVVGRSRHSSADFTTIRPAVTWSKWLSRRGQTARRPDQMDQTVATSLGR